ncbi:integrase core domain-containing protein [Deinococcus aerolatus]|uniref:integrase core domain-containing protein n=1 Tax=Deinococcus aerolatus TaxID=522487 RepID=UPI00166B9F30
MGRRDNGSAESFHARLRPECLNQEIFSSAKHAQVLLDDWGRSTTPADHTRHSATGPQTSLPSSPGGGRPPPLAETTPQMCTSARPWGSRES